MTVRQWHLRDRRRVLGFSRMYVIFFFFLRGSTRVGMGDQQTRIRDEGVRLKSPAAVAKLLNCRYQHNMSAGVGGERQLLDRTITRIRRTLTSRVSLETSRRFAAGRRSPNWILRNLLLTGLQERTFALRGNCLCNCTLGSARISNERAK